MVTSKGEKKGFSKYNNPAVVTFKSTRDTDFYSTLCIMNGYGLRVHRAPDVIFITAAFFLIKWRFQWSPSRSKCPDNFYYAGCLMTRIWTLIPLSLLIIWVNCTCASWQFPVTVAAVPKKKQTNKTRSWELSVFVRESSIRLDSYLNHEKNDCCTRIIPANTIFTPQFTAFHWGGSESHVELLRGNSNVRKAIKNKKHVQQFDSLQDYLDEAKRSNSALYDVAKSWRQAYNS